MLEQACVRQEINGCSCSPRSISENLSWDISNSRAIWHEFYSCLAAAAIVAFLLLGVPTVRGRYACTSALGVPLPVPQRRC